MYSRRRSVRVAALAVATSSALVLSACGGGNSSGSNQGAGQTSAPQSSVGNRVQMNPAQFVGCQVTLAGQVGQSLGPNVFSVVTGNGGNGGGGTAVGAAGGATNTGGGAGGNAATGGNGGLVGNGGNGGAGGNAGTAGAAGTCAALSGNSANAGNNANGGTNANSGTNGNGGTQQGILVLDKNPVNLKPGSPVQVTGMLAPGFTTQAAQSFLGTAPSNPAINTFADQPYLQAQFVAPTISANLTYGNNGGFFGGGVFGGTDIGGGGSGNNH